MSVPFTRTCPLTVELDDLWHAGSGRGQGRVLDAVPVVDAEGLPYLPGRQLKGLLRDALRCLETWGHAPAGTEARLFGGEAQGTAQDLRLRRSEPGCVAVSNAVLGDAERQWLCSPDGRRLMPELFRDVFSTAIDEHGTANDQSLRGMQVVVPVRLQAQVRLEAADEAAARVDLEHLRRAAALVQHVGAKRSRGYGRARLVLEAEALA